MPATARQHFNQDIQRALALHQHGPTASNVSFLEDDLYRWSVAAAVGAMDAYLCDAYVDCLTRALRAFRMGVTKKIPSDYAKELLPAGPLLSDVYTSRMNWALRMAARHRMEKENMLQLGRAKQMFNPILPSGQKLWDDIIVEFIKLDRKRLTGVDSTEYSSTRERWRAKTRKKAAGTLLKRLGNIVQRRHDVVHNCDRPKSAPQRITVAAAKKMIGDVVSFVTILDNHLDAHRVC